MGGDVSDYDDDSVHARSQGGIAMHVHGDGGRAHSHAPPPSGSVTWRSMLALGISGGLLPCPSALVVLLSAVAFDRAGFGLLLIVSFSLGLAFTLTAIGIFFVYAGRFVNIGRSSPVLTRVLPAASAFVVMCVGIVICYGAILESGLVSVR
jgi:ABC-type nickel/cobalt efflux system permease component RcnA